MRISLQFFGIILTLGGSALLVKYGDFACHIFFCAVLSVGFLMTGKNSVAFATLWSVFITLNSREGNMKSLDMISFKVIHELCYSFFLRLQFLSVRTYEDNELDNQFRMNIPLMLRIPSRQEYLSLIKCSIAHLCTVYMNERYWQRWWLWCLQMYSQTDIKSIFWFWFLLFFYYCLLFLITNHFSGL